MITVHINDTTKQFATQKEVDRHIQQAVKNHLSHPWFMNMDKIEDLDIKAMKRFDNEKWAAGERCAKLRIKLMHERDEYLTKNEIKEPPQLRVTIKHQHIYP